MYITHNTIQSMAKRKTGISPLRMVKRPRKTKKRLAAKKVMLAKKAAGKKKK